MSVLGLLRELGAGKRLTTLLERESLFNDGASVVAFGVLVEFAIDPQPSQLSTTVLRCVVVTGVGLGIDGLIGVCVALLSQRYELAWVEQSLTLVTAYGTYLLVEEIGGSEAIGVVTAALVIGNFSARMGVEPLKRSTMVEFWEFIVFFVDSILFLLLGDQIHLEFANQQLQQLHNDIQCIQEQHPQLQAFSLQQYQEKLLSIKSETYAKFVHWITKEFAFPDYAESV